MLIGSKVMYIKRVQKNRRSIILISIVNGIVLGIYSFIKKWGSGESTLKIFNEKKKVVFLEKDKIKFIFLIQK